MKILNIEESIEPISVIESQDNLEKLKKLIRSCWERGEDPEILKYINHFSLLDTDKNQYQHWYQDYAEFNYLQKIIDIEADEIVFHNHTCVSLLKESRCYREIDFLNPFDFERSIELFARKNGQEFHFQNPFVSFQAQIKNLKLRVSLTHKSIAPGSTHKMFIRIFKKKTFEFKDYIDEKKYLEEIVSLKKNVLFVGATGSGKTSLMQSILEKIPVSEHVITIEDTFELKSENTSFTQLVARKGVSLNDLLTFSLRMTPDRLVIGEIRSHEVVTALLAMNTGHKGVMTSLHANSALDAFHRLALLFTLYSKNSSVKNSDVLKMLTRNIDYVVFLENKKIKEIISPLGGEGSDIYFDTIFSLE